MKNSYIERALELPQGYLSKKENLELPETKALLKIVENFPFVVSLADFRFDEQLCNFYLQKLAIEYQINNRIDEITKSSQSIAES